VRDGPAGQVLWLHGLSRSRRERVFPQQAFQLPAQFLRPGPQAAAMSPPAPPHPAPKRIESSLMRASARGSCGTFPGEFPAHPGAARAIPGPRSGARVHSAVVCSVWSGSFSPHVCAGLSGGAPRTRPATTRPPPLRRSAEPPEQDGDLIGPGAAWPHPGLSHDSFCIRTAISNGFSGVFSPAFGVAVWKGSPGRRWQVSSDTQPAA